MKKTATLGLLLITLAGGAGLGWYASWQSWQYAAPTTAAQAPPATASVVLTPAPVAVETMPVARRPVARGITAVGSLRSDETVVLRPEVAGLIREIRFQEGQPVTQGQVLVRLDDAIARAELAQASANLALAQSQNRRAASLQAEGFISQQGRDEATNNLKVQQAAVALARARLDKTVIVAPFAGVIGLRNVSVGDYVNAGQDLVQLEAINPLKVDFRVPEMYLTQVRAGQALEVRFDALPEIQRAGVVVAISPVVDAGARSLSVRAQVPNDDGLLRPGLFARVQLLFAREEVLVVPEAALAPAGQVQYVYRVVNSAGGEPRAGQQAERVAVVIGQRRDGVVEIREGLQEGDMVVVAGLQRLSDGAPVVVHPAAMRPPANPAGHAAATREQQP